MENLPDSLYIDPTLDIVPNSSTLGPNPMPTNLRSATVEQLIPLLLDPRHREDVLSLLSKKKGTCKDLALKLWNSFNTVFVLLQEVLLLYPLLSPPNLSMKASTRACNALSLMQCMASHPDTRMDFIKANLPVYLYPIIKTTETQKPFDFARLCSLGVIGSLVKVEDSNTPQVTKFLLENEIVPLCLKCMETGNELTQTVATFIMSKILKGKEGFRYCSTFADNFFAVGYVLSGMIQKLSIKPPRDLLKYIISCYLSLTQLPRACDALSHCFPARLTDPTFVYFACEDITIKQMLRELLNNVNTGQPSWCPVGDMSRPSTSTMR